MIVLSGLYVVEMNLRDWRADELRPHYEYTVKIDGLSGTEVSGTTKILVPIPATKEGVFAITPSQEKPSFFKSLLQEYVFHTPEKYIRGIYFENTTESLDNKSLNGNWTTSIVSTKHGPMLEFRTNESVLADISFSKIVVLEQMNNEDPINESSPILYPIASEVSSVGEDYQYFRSMSRVITYETYIEMSDNINSKDIINKDIKFDISLEVYPDVTERDGDKGTYKNKLDVVVAESGELKKNATIETYF
ncbi:hypothetical protein [Methanosarcina barkeri]|uniref:hypothetical protein n=1 Tax=Methanosarcina barkeri TaxID=2208 RepID=UPI00064E360A|nr:hypothetical protein [Methanosarcina barkeri]OED06743.1 hypothetical protein A9239_11140 [Methanosarcina sp. A14]